VVERLSTPAQARRGQSIDLRASIRATARTEGRIELRVNGEPVDLDPASDRTGLSVELDPGANLVVLPAVPSGGGAQRFEATFVPDDPSGDGIPENNVGAAVVFVGGEGRVAIVAPPDGVDAGPLAQALEAAGIEAVAVQPEEAMRGGLPWLAGFDAVILANVPRWEFDNAFDRALHAYCHDLGGGLLMLGGPNSFGAGGWNGSETARALPVKLDPPQTRVLLRMSVALVIDCSGSMGAPVRGTGMNQQEVAGRAALTGIRSLSRADEACVVGFSGEPTLVSPREPIGTGEAVAARVGSMLPGGGTNLFPAMELAMAQLKASRTRNRHMVILTDGQTQGEPAVGVGLARAARAAGISVSTIGVGDGANDALLKSIASVGGGRFHAVDSQASADRLPQVFVRELAFEGRQLIEEGDHVPTLLGVQGGPLSGIPALPAIRGYVLTAPRGAPAQVGAIVRTKEGDDPFIAWHNYGVGRSLALTGDLSPRWAPAWKAWPGFQAFVEQAVRWSMRPSDDRSVAVDARVEDGRATVSVRTDGGATGFAPRMRAEGRLVDPSGRAVDLPLRQVGAGRFEGGFDASRTGAWLVSVVTASEDAAGSARARVTHASISVPYAAEYRSLRDDEASLRAIADRTRGRVIEVDQLPRADLFDRTGMVPSRGSRQLWDILAMVAAMLLVADVAWRRLVFDRRDVRELLAVAVASSVRAGGSSSGAPGGSRTQGSPGAGAPAEGGGPPPERPGDTLSRLGQAVRRRRAGS
jgi:Ca-activated chloride channel family protein